MAVTSSLWTGVLLVAVLYAVMLYNGLVEVKHAVSKHWANIDVLLKQRYDELPKLIETCKQYQQFEASTLQRVTQARAQALDARLRQDVPALGQAEAALRTGLGQVFAVVERYPELHANESFQTLMSRITALENAIADRRELYNEAVNINNVRIEKFPDLVLARAFKFGPQSLLDFTDAEKADVDVKALFS
ncbi:MAG: LemA family protein [Burkholderiaceae bacterium]|nr:LemA family protein [Roseateles sp.]MBV8468521.1 LemA family protein [Burkholderiaceae bacterium]